MFDESTLSFCLENTDYTLQQLNKIDAEESLLDYIKLMWAVNEPQREFKHGWAVDAICEHLEAISRGEITRLLINVPPGCMKSLTSNVFWPSWEWGPRNRGDLRYISAAYAEPLTIRDNRRCRNIITSDLYQQLWGDRFQLAGDQNAKTKFENTKTGFKLATSVGGVATGERGDRFVIDDPHNVKDGESDPKRESAIQWFTEVVPTRINDADESAIMVIMQRVHERDVSGLILAKELNYEHLCLPMEFEKKNRCFTSVPRDGIEPERVARLHIENIPIPPWIHDESEIPEEVDRNKLKLKWRYMYSQDRRDVEGELLWPNRFSEDYLEGELKPTLRAWGGMYAEAGQLQQRPTPRGGGMFQRKDFNFLDKQPERGLFVRGYDLAATEDAGAYTVGVLMCLTPDGKVIICDVAREQLSPSGVDNLMISLADADGKRVDIDVPQDPGQAGKAQKSHIIRLLHGYTVHFSPESGSKPDRAKPLSSQSEGGNLYLVRGAWNSDFVNEAIVFPNGATLDQVDAASRAYAALLRKPKRRIPVGPTLIQG